MPSFSPIRILTRGFGGPASAIMIRSFLSMRETVDEIRRNVVGRSSNKGEISLYDDVDVYKISAMLVSINKQPLNNKLYNKMTRLIVEKKIQINAELDKIKTQNSSPYRIVIADKPVKRGIDE